jgi:hypothetical protein
MSADHLFDRELEREALRQRLRQRRSLLIHGPAGVGKTLLLKAVLPDFPDALYCFDSSTVLTVLRNLAGALLQRRSARLAAACGRSGLEAIRKKSAVSLKGIVLDALRDGEFVVVLDHISRPAAAFGATVREIIGWASTPVVAVARSPHMEDIGSLHSLFADRQDRFELRNFDSATAERFARDAVNRVGLEADNMEEFLTRVLQLSRGNPGTIFAMLEMAKQPRYRSARSIKVTPLHIDFRLSGLQ